MAKKPKSKQPRTPKLPKVVYVHRENVQDEGGYLAVSDDAETALDRHNDEGSGDIGMYQLVNVVDIIRKIDITVKPK